MLSRSNRAIRRSAATRGGRSRRRGPPTLVLLLAQSTRTINANNAQGRDTASGAAKLWSAAPNGSSLHACHASDFSLGGGDGRPTQRTALRRRQTQAALSREAASPLCMWAYRLRQWRVEQSQEGMSSSPGDAKCTRERIRRRSPKHSGSGVSLPRRRRAWLIDRRPARSRLLSSSGDTNTSFPRMPSGRDT